MSDFFWQPPLSLIKVQKMNELYKLNDVKNSEVRFRYDFYFEVSNDGKP